MELLRIRRRRDLAKRGHKLLKDKLDGLIQKFTSILKENEKNWEIIVEAVSKALSLMVIAGSEIGREFLNTALLFPKMDTGIEIAEVNMMGVYVPKYILKTSGEEIPYGFAFTGAELDQTIIKFKKVLPELISYAQRIKALRLLGDEIIKVKRRVNALEYILIPELESSLKEIRMKLSEMERSYITSLMKIKDIVRAR